MSVFGSCSFTEKTCSGQGELRNVHLSSGQDRHEADRPGAVDSEDWTLSACGAGMVEDITRIGFQGISTSVLRKLQQIFEEDDNDDISLCPPCSTREDCRIARTVGGTSDGTPQESRQREVLHSAVHVGQHQDDGRTCVSSSVHGNMWPDKLNRLEALLDCYEYAENFWDPYHKSGPPHSRRACYEGTIADSPSTHICLERFLEDFPACRKSFEWLLDADCILGGSGKLESLGAGPKNAKLEDHVGRLLELDIAERMPHSVRSRILNSAFCVPKKTSGSLRFILNPAILNQALKGAQIPNCNLPPYRKIRETMMSAAWCVQFDFKSYYFQFVIPERVRNLFAFRAGSTRLRMRRAPMGYKATPQAGQLFAETLAKEAAKGSNVNHLVWMDNVVFVADDRERLAEVASRFQDLCKRYRVVEGDVDPITRKLCAFGIEWDLANGRFRLKPEWVRGVSRVSSYIWEPRPLRFMYKICGLLVWRFYALGGPMRRLTTILRWMSMATAGTKSWSDLVSFEAGVSESVQGQLAMLQNNRWVYWQKSYVLTDVRIATDASDKGWGVFFHSDKEESAGAFLMGNMHDIYVKEMFALCRGVLEVLIKHGKRVHISIDCDNKAVIASIARGFTLVNTAAELLSFTMSIVECCESEISVFYIPSALNPADKPSRQVGAV
eukprot:TRINITY_DN6452_c0_g1_i2.p1 TRINITY_DN6452_c0_g1~~TRINITY_DN6452_c0_g1_i2.p1  ORF type:complete len:668 (+),score=7.94 TRINITY_DN6452_c0_g1_i2:932-2935(+)